MNINSISANSIAASVWTVATRNLTNPSGVFSDATRTLTSVASVFAAVSGRSVVGTGVVLDLRPAAGVFRELVISEITQASTAQISLYDGVNSDTVGTANTGVAQHTTGNATRGGSFRNNSAGNLTAVYAGFDIT